MSLLYWKDFLTRRLDGKTAKINFILSLYIIRTNEFKKVLNVRISIHF